MDPMTTHGAFSWVEFQGDGDAAGKAQNFYQQVLGWQVIDMPMADGGTYAGITVGEKPVGGFSDKGAGQGQWLPYVTVDQVDERVRVAEEAGGQILAPAFDAPGVGRIAVVPDPLGARIAFIQYEAPAS